MRLLFALFFAAILAGSAHALPGTPVLSGGTPFDYTYDGRILRGQIDYAVYEVYPGTVPGPGAYVYAYQIFNDASSNVAIDSFSLSILEDAAVGDIGWDDFGVVGGIEPSHAYFSPDAATAQSAIYLFLPFMGGLIGADEYSVIMLFTSDNEPTESFGILEGGSIGTMVNGLPTPVPEPATVLLLGIGALSLTGMGRRRRARDF